jgi:hypothetical protein
LVVYALINHRSRKTRRQHRQTINARNDSFYEFKAPTMGNDSPFSSAARPITARRFSRSQDNQQRKTKLLPPGPAQSLQPGKLFRDRFRHRLSSA